MGDPRYGLLELEILLNLRQIGRSQNRTEALLIRHVFMPHVLKYHLTALLNQLDLIVPSHGQRAHQKRAETRFPVHREIGTVLFELGDQQNHNLDYIDGLKLVFQQMVLKICLDRHGLVAIIRLQHGARYARVEQRKLWDAHVLQKLLAIRSGARGQFNKRLSKQPLYRRRASIIGVIEE